VELEITAIVLTGSRDETVDVLSNLKAAKALGLTFPPTWIVPANQVIE